MNVVDHFSLIAWEMLCLPLSWIRERVRLSGSEAPLQSLEAEWIIRSMNADELQQFIPPWLQSYLAGLTEADRKKFLQDYEAAIEEILQKLSELPANQFADGTERGNFSVHIPGTNKFVNLKSAIWTSAKYAGPLVLAGVLAPPLLGVLGISVASAHLTVGGGASAGYALYQAFSQLDDFEMDTYKAVAAAIERNKNRVLENEGASEDQIKASFGLDRDLMMPFSGLPTTLAQLEKKKVIESKVIAGVNQYFLSF